MRSPIDESLGYDFYQKHQAADNTFILKLFILFRRLCCVGWLLAILGLRILISKPIILEILLPVVFLL